MMRESSILRVACVIVSTLCGTCLSSDGIDYRKAFDILTSNNPQSEMRSLSTELDFVQFMRDFDKVYSSPDELAARLNNYQQNLKKIEEAEKANVGTAQFGVTKFADHSDEELEMYSGLRVPDVDSMIQNLRNDDDDFDDADIHRGSSAPGAFDWRLRGVITPIKDQQRCGACWAFSAIGCIEAHHAIKTNNLVPLSVQQLIDCDKIDDGCVGGFMHDAFQYIMEAGGVVPSADYPYLTWPNPIESQHCNISEADQRKVVKVTSYRNITGGEEAMKNHLYQHGPLSIGINANYLHFYQRGILDLSEERCNPRGLNHGVLIVGYGVETLRDGSSLPYWIVKNSWDPNWGEHGFFRVRRGTNVCGVAVLVSTVETN